MRYSAPSASVQVMPSSPASVACSFCARRFRLASSPVRSSRYSLYEGSPSCAAAPDLAAQRRSSARRLALHAWFFEVFTGSFLLEVYFKDEEVAKCLKIQHKSGIQALTVLPNSNRDSVGAAS